MTKDFRLCNSLSTTPERLKADIQNIATEVGMHRYYINVHHDGGFLNINNFVKLSVDPQYTPTALTAGQQMLTTTRYCYGGDSKSLKLIRNI